MDAFLNTEHATRFEVRTHALINDAFRRVVHTGAHLQVAVMTLAPDGEIGEEADRDTDQLYVLVEGVGEARVGDDVLEMEPGDLVFVEAGRHHNIVNRAVAPLRLIAVCAPPAYPAGAVQQTRVGNSSQHP